MIVTDPPSDGPKSVTLTTRDPIAHVDSRPDDAPTESGHEPAGLGEVLGRGRWVLGAGDRSAEVDGDDVGAFLCEAQRVAAALPASCAGDERNLPVDASHPERPPSSEIELPDNTRYRVSVTDKGGAR